MSESNALFDYRRPGRIYALTVIVAAPVGYLAAAFLVGGGQLP